MTEHAVVIAGGGPTGLMLAGELAGGKVISSTILALWFARIRCCVAYHLFQNISEAVAVQMNGLGSRLCSAMVCSDCRYYRIEAPKGGASDSLRCDVSEEPFNHVELR
jgi:hypothetical protein